jgi:hypothetical protein
MMLEIDPRMAATVSDVRIPGLRHGTDMFVDVQFDEWQRIPAATLTLKLYIVIENRKDRENIGNVSVLGPLQLVPFVFVSFITARLVPVELPKSK